MANHSNRSPVVTLLAALLILWLVYFLLRATLGLFWIIVILFVIAYLSNTRFRGSVRELIDNLFRR
jgi:amino acid transporter